MTTAWNPKDQIGELQIKQKGKELTINIYKGKALAIFIHEFTNSKGIKKCKVYDTFFTMEHFCKCAEAFNYAEEWVKLTLWEIPNDFWMIILKDLFKRGVEINLAKK